MQRSGIYLRSLNFLKNQSKCRSAAIQGIAKKAANYLHSLHA